MSQKAHKLVWLGHLDSAHHEQREQDENGRAACQDVGNDQPGLPV